MHPKVMGSLATERSSQRAENLSERDSGIAAHTASLMLLLIECRRGESRAFHCGFDEDEPMARLRLR